MFFKPAIVTVFITGLSSLHIVSAYAVNPQCTRGKFTIAVRLNHLTIRGISFAQPVLPIRWRCHKDREPTPKQPLFGERQLVRNRTLVPTRLFIIINSLWFAVVEYSSAVCRPTVH